MPGAVVGRARACGNPRPLSPGPSPSRGEGCEARKFVLWPSTPGDSHSPQLTFASIRSLRSRRAQARPDSTQTM